VRLGIQKDNLRRSFTRSHLLRSRLSACASRPPWLAASSFPAWRSLHCGDHAANATGSIKAGSVGRRQQDT